MTGQALKQHAMAQVLAGDTTLWYHLASVLVLAYLRRHGPCLLEEARGFCERACLPPPTHPNAWGALAGRLSSSNAIEMTGVWQASSDPRSHARLQPHWRTT